MFSVAIHWGEPEKASAYFVGISVGELVLSHGDNLSATLQSSTLSAAEGQRVASLIVNTLAKIRTAKSFSSF